MTAPNAARVCTPIREGAPVKSLLSKLTSISPIFHFVKTQSIEVAAHKDSSHLPYLIASSSLCPFR